MASPYFIMVSHFCFGNFAVIEFLCRTVILLITKEAVAMHCNLIENLTGGIARSAPPMRGLKRLRVEHYIPNCIHRNRAICPAYEGIETFSTIMSPFSTIMNRAICPAYEGIETKMNKKDH